MGMSRVKMSVRARLFEIITSFALSGDREKAAAAGATRYLAKPYSPRELMTLVREILPET